MLFGIRDRVSLRTKPRSFSQVVLKWSKEKLRHFATASIVSYPSRQTTHEVTGGLRGNTKHWASLKDWPRQCPFFEQFSRFSKLKRRNFNCFFLAVLKIVNRRTGEIFSRGIFKTEPRNFQNGSGGIFNCFFGHLSLRTDHTSGDAADNLLQLTHFSKSL